MPHQRLTGVIGNATSDMPTEFVAHVDWDARIGDIRIGTRTARLERVSADQLDNWFGFDFVPGGAVAGFPADSRAEIDLVCTGPDTFEGTCRLAGIQIGTIECVVVDMPDDGRAPLVSPASRPPRSRARRRNEKMLVS